MHFFIAKLAPEAERSLRCDLDALVDECPVASPKQHHFSHEGFEAVAFEVANRLFPDVIRTDGNTCTLMDGYAFGIDDASLDPLAGDKTPEQFQREFSGEYALINYDGRKLTAFTDMTGVCPLYYWRKAGTTIISNRVEFIRLHLAAQGISLSYNTDAIGSLCSWGFIPHGRTLYSEVRAFRAAEWMEVESRRITHSDSPQPFFSTHVDELVDPERPDWHSVLHELRANVRFIHDFKGARLGLSGGKDSRLVLAACLAEGVADKMEFFTNGIPESPDVIVGSSIARRFGLNHQIVSPPEHSPVPDVIKVYKEAFPRSAYFGEGMLNGFEPHANGYAGAPPILAGLTGENFRAAFDHHGNSTAGIVDTKTLLKFMLGKVWLDPAGLLLPNAKARQADIRTTWTREQLRLGIAPDQVPNIFYAEWQSYRRNHAFRKVNGVNRHVINAINGPRMLNLAGRLTAFERRAERIHYEVTKACSVELAHHVFAMQRWEPALGAPEASPVLFAGNAAKKKAADTHWRSHIHSHAALKSAIRDSILSAGADNELWGIVSRDSMLAFLDKPQSAHLERFCFCGALTALHHMGGNLDRRKMRVAS